MRRIRWTTESTDDLSRVFDFLAPHSLTAAAAVVRALHATPARLTSQPRIGARLPQFSPREVRRLFVGDYELRYELRPDAIIVLNVWHTREDR